MELSMVRIAGRTDSVRVNLLLDGYKLVDGGATMIGVALKAMSLCSTANHPCDVDLV